jgi:hypothetical protein
MVVRSRSRTWQRAPSRIVIAVVVTACGAGPTVPTAPTPSMPSSDYAGLWSGTTAQGTPVTFTISTDEKVTTISIAHSFDGCSESRTFSGLTLPILRDVQCARLLCTPTASPLPQFVLTRGNVGHEPSIQFVGLFPSTTQAEGFINLRDYPGCADALVVRWNATRR